MKRTDLEILEADTWFAGIERNRRERLLKEARIEVVSGPTKLYGVGDPPNGLWAVVEGQVRLKSLSKHGFEILALIMRPGTWFGELSTLDGEPRPHDAVAHGPARLVHVPTAAFARAAGAEPALYRDLGLLVCAHQRTALQFIAQNGGQSVQARLAQQLMRTSPSAPGWLNIRQEEIAAVVGVARQTLNRHLKRFERDGLIDIAYAQIRIIDMQGLEAIVMKP